MPEDGPLTERPHGTRARYQVDHCRCLPCRSANAAYRPAEPRSAWVEAGPAQAHCHRLRAQGVGVRRIAQLAQVSERLVWQVVAGTRTVLRPSHAARLLAVEVSPALGVRIPFHRAWRLVRLLLREGFTRAQIRRAIGRRAQLSKGQPSIRLRSALLLRRLYREHCCVDDETDETDMG